MLDSILSHPIFWIIEIIVGIGLVIFIHELGHFIMAKRNGVRVEIFSLGFGPAILRRRRGETEYRISWIPLGGYVKMAGEQHSEKEDPQPYELTSKSAWARFQIFVAGATMNLLLAFPVLVIAAIVGKWEYDTVVGSPGAAEAAAGMRPGDRILSVNGDPVQSLADYKMMIVGEDQGAAAAVVVERGGRQEALSVVVRKSEFHALTPPSTTVTAVLPNTPAAAAGIRGTSNRDGIRGDVLASVNGTPVYSPYHYGEILEANFGKPTTLTFQRSDGGTIDVRVEPKPLPETVKRFPEDWRLRRPVVGTVSDGTPASMARPEPLMTDDLITRVEGTEIRSWHDLREAIKPRGGLETRITVQRAGVEHVLTAVPSYNETGGGLLGVAYKDTPEIADVAPDSIYAGLRPGDVIQSVNGVKKAGVGSIFAASNPEPEPQGPPFLRDLSLFEFFLLGVVAFGLITLGPVSWIWINKVEPNRRREVLRFGVTLGGALAAMLVWAAVRPAAKPVGVTDVTVEVLRDGKQQFVTIKPAEVKRVDYDAIGISTAAWDYQRVYRQRPLKEAVAYGVKEPINIIVLTAGLLKKLVMGRESTSGLAGPVGIFQFSYKSAEQGPGNLLWILGLITVNLGVFNLLPVPLLDGGHVALLPYEIVFKRRPSPKFEAAYQWTGLVLLLSLVVFVTWNDIQRILS